MGCCFSRDQIIIDFTPLHDACNHRDVEKVKQLLFLSSSSSSPDSTSNSNTNSTTSHHPNEQQQEQKEQIRKLLHARTPQANMTALQISCSAREPSKETTEICRLLVDAGADDDIVPKMRKDFVLDENEVNSANNNNNNNSSTTDCPLILAVRFGNLPVVRDVFIPRLATTMKNFSLSDALNDTKNSKGENSLVLACRLTNSKTALELAKLLVQNGASIEASVFNEGKSNALTVALLNDHEDVFVELVENDRKKKKTGTQFDLQSLLPKPTIIGIENWKQFAEKRGMKKVVKMLADEDENTNNNSTSNSEREPIVA